MSIWDDKRIKGMSHREPIVQHGRALAEMGAGEDEAAIQMIQALVMTLRSTRDQLTMAAYEKCPDLRVHFPNDKSPRE